MPDLGFVHAFVPGSAGDPRTLVLLHGTGGDERDLLSLGAAILPGAARLGVRGTVLEGGMARFFRRVAPGVFDEADLVARAKDLASFMRRAGEAYGRDLGAVTAVGFSNGANMAAAVMLLEPGLIRRAVLFRPMVPLRAAGLPKLAGTAVLVAAGRRDPLVPQAATEELVDLLRGAGAAVTVRWSEAGHALHEADVDEARGWLAGSP